MNHAVNSHLFGQGYGEPVLCRRHPMSAHGVQVRKRISATQIFFYFSISTLWSVDYTVQSVDYIVQRVDYTLQTVDYALYT